MPGRKKGRQRKDAGSKAQCARKWNDILKDAREELAADKKTKFVRPRDTAPPRLSAQGFRSLATLLHQRVRSDQVETEGREAGITPGSNIVPALDVSSTRTARNEGYFSVQWLERHPPRRTRTLLSLCISQIGRDFLAYRTDDEAVAQAFLLLPARCVSRISRVASASAAVADHNIGLLCSPDIASLWLRGRFTDEGANVLLPVLHGGIPTDETHLSRGGGEGKIAVGEACVVPGGAEDWESADDRMEACLQGGVSITSLDISSPLLSSKFVERLALRIPSLRRLGLRGSLDMIGGPDAVCNKIPRLTALRELDVSHCTWFGDLCLRRFVKTMWRRQPFPPVDDLRYPHRMIAMAQDEGEANWGAASTLASGVGPPPHVQRWPRDVPTSGTGVQGREVSVEQIVHFRAFTLTCAHTGVTEKGARTAEVMSPGLLVVLEDTTVHTAIG